MAKVAGGKGRKKRGDHSFAQFIELFEGYENRRDWDKYLKLAGRPKFQEALAAEAVRTGGISGTGPTLRVLDNAIERATSLGRIADAAGLTLSRARWTRRLELRSAHAVPGPGDPGTADDLPSGLDRELLVLQTLLRAWELHDAGNPGAARAALGDLIRLETPMLRSGDGWAVPLLRHAMDVNADFVGVLLQRPLVDDNVLTDLSNALIEAGELTRARTAALAIRLFTGSKVKALGEIAVRQSQAGDWSACAETEVLAQRAVADTDAATGDSFIFEGRTLLAAARVLCGAPDSGKAALANMIVEAGQQSEALATVATAQVRAGLLADAERTIAAIPDNDDPRWEAAATLVAALAERGDVIGATQALSYVWADAFCYPRAVRALAGAVAHTDLVGAERLARDLPRASARGHVLAEVATVALAAGHREEAVRMATGIEDPRWQARALLDLARAPAPAPDGMLPGSQVLDAIAGVPDAETRAVLLAQYAVTRDGAQRAQLLGDAKKLAKMSARDERWVTLAEIASVEADAGVPDAAQTFAAARTLVLADREVEEQNLRELCHLQELAGDSAGARQTVADALPRIATSSIARFAAVIGAHLAAVRAPLAPPRGVAWAAGVDGPEPETDRLLAPVTLAALAVVMAQSMAVGLDAAGVRVAESESIAAILATAARLAGTLRDDQRVAAVEALAHAHLVAGDLDAAERIVLALLPAEGADEADRDEDGDGDGDEADTLLAAIRVGVTFAAALAAKDEWARAAALLRSYAGRLAGLSRDAEYWPAAEVCAMLAVAQGSARAIDDARATAALDPTGTAETALGAWEAGPQEAAGRERPEKEAAEAERADRDQGWQEVMLATSALATLPPDGVAHESAAGPPDFNALHGLVDFESRLGAPGVPVQLEVIDHFIAAGQYSAAANFAKDISADAGAHLARIIVTLGAEALDTAGEGSPARSAGTARAAVLSLLPWCSRYPRSAHAACVALAMAFPSTIVAIADAVRRNAESATAPTPDA